jgi:hypothetical protein
LIISLIELILSLFKKKSKYKKKWKNQSRERNGQGLKWKKKTRVKLSCLGAIQIKKIICETKKARQKRRETQAP